MTTTATHRAPRHSTGIPDPADTMKAFAADPLAAYDHKHSATYHGIASVQCLSCYDVHRDRGTVETWNDLAPWCDDCDREVPARWTMTDGTTAESTPETDDLP